MRPEPKSDQELGLDEGPKFFRGTPALLFADTKSPSGRFVQNAKDAPGTEAYASRHAGDEMNDPGAQMITGAALAAPLSAAAPAAIAPMVSGAQQSAMAGQNPLVGAALGAIPLVPRAAGAAKSAAEEAILSRALRQPPPGKLSKLVGQAAGGVVGGAVGGVPGAVVGTAAGRPVAAGVNAAANKAAQALAARQLANAANSADPALVADVAGRMAPKPEPAVAPGGRLPVTDADIVSNEPAPFPMPDKLRLNPLPQAPKGALSPAEKAQIIRDAQRFRTAPDDVDVPPEPDLEDLLKRSIEEAKRRKAAASQ
jgi:hypothetical protein